MSNSEIIAVKISKGRIDYIDTAKAIGICLVVFGHATIPNELKIFIYSFHMPLFFLLTGLTFKICETKKFFKKRIVSLILPYVLLSILFVVKDLAASLLLHDRTLQSVAKECLGIFCAMGQSEYSVKPLWFLPCIFICETLLFALIKLLKNKKPLILLVSAALCILSFLLSEHFSLQCPWFIDVAAFSILFMAVGYVFKDKINAFATGSNIAKNSVFGVVALLGCIIVSHYNYAITNQIVMFAFSEYANLFLTIAAAFLGIIAVLAFANLCNSKLSLYIGKNTLFIYGVHYFFLIGSIDIRICNIISPDIQNNNILCTLAAVAFSVVIMVACCVLAKPYNAVMNKVKEKLLS